MGEWKDGEKNGHGTKTYTDRRKYVGKWKDGKLWNGTFYNKDGIIKVKNIMIMTKMFTPTNPT